jgi:hypothetical protein
VPLRILPILTVLAAPLSAQVTLRRLDSAPTIDGVLDEDAWRSASRLGGFVQTHPGDNVAPSFPTTVLIGFDARNLYLAVRALDDATRVRATLAARDDILDDDHVLLYLDTFGDRRRAYVLGFNPLGVQQDGMFVEGTAEPDYSIDVVMRSRGRIDANGWTVEVAIPLASLRYAASAGGRWHAHVQRRIKHLDDEQMSWRPLMRGASGFLTQAGALTGVDALPGRRSIELYPAVTAFAEGERVAGPGGAPAERWSEATRGDVSLTARVGLTSDVTADLTVNPDFAHVEADAPVVTANQRFPLLVEEKRPFFLEGIDLFRTSLNVVHTRSIVDPVAAAKITGKRGRTAFGVLVASDEAPGRFSDAERADAALAGTIERIGGRNGLVGVARLRREAGGASSVGLLGTAYRFVDRDNVTLGTDVRLARTHTVARLELVGSRSHRPFHDPELGRDTLRVGYGLGYHAELGATSRHIDVTLTGDGWSPDYITETGFTRQVDTNAWRLVGRWRSDPRAGGLLVSWELSQAAHAQFDWRGRTTYAWLWPQLSLRLPRLTKLTAGPYVDYQRLFEEEFGPRRGPGRAGAFAGAGYRRTVYRGFGASAETTPHPTLRMWGSASWSWDFFDLDLGDGPAFPRVSPAALADPSAPLDPGVGTAFGGTVGWLWKPAPALRVGTEYTRSRLRRYDTGRVAHDETLVSAQVVYQPTRFVAVRLRADHRSSRSTLRPQLLVSWTPGPGSAVYVGYNDDFTNDGFSRVTGTRQPGLRRNARTAFVKLSWLTRVGIP